MRVRLFALMIVAAMIASTLLPAVAAEQGSSEDESTHGEARYLLADPPDCPDWAGIDALFAAKQAEILAELGKESAPRDFVFGAVVAGEGEVSTDGPNPLYVIAYAAYKAAQEASLLIETDKQRYEQCQNDAHRELLRIVDDKIDELTNITETDDTENNRIQIENALYPCTPLVGFYLPAANGGQLETVRDVVDESITGSAGAGYDVTSAQNAYNTAVGVMNQGAYRDAFIAFCAAYGQLIAASGANDSNPVPRTTGSGYLYFCIDAYTGAIKNTINPTAALPDVDPRTLCSTRDRPLEVVGWFIQ